MGSPAAPAHVDLRSVSYGNGQFVAVGGLYRGLYPEGSVLTSPDGVTWTARYQTPLYLPACAYGNNRFVAVGGPILAGQDMSVILTSPDGDAWASQSSGTTNYLNAIVYADGNFLAVGDGGELLTSTDGTSWAERNPFWQNLYAVTYANGTFVAVGGAGTILNSQPLPDFVNAGKIVARPLGLNGQFQMDIAGQAGQTYVIEVSIDLANWRPLANVVGTAA